MQRGSTSPVQRLEVDASDRELCAIRDFIARTCTELGFGGRALANIRLAVDEACTNVVKHAYAGRPGALRVEVAGRRGWLEIRVLDQGEPFDGRVEIPQLRQLVNARRRGGLGVFLMHRLMDDVRYQTTPAGNEWILRKRLPQPAACFAARMRWRYGLRMSLVLLAATVAVCVPLGVHEGRQRSRAEEHSLCARADGLAEAARPVLLQRAELSLEQTHLFEAVHALVRQEPRLLAVTVVDRDLGIWASDRSAATFTRFLEPAGLGAPDANGVRRMRERIDGEPVLHLAVPVRLAPGSPELGAVHLSLRWRTTAEAIRTAHLHLALGALLVNAVGLLLLALFLGRFLRPLQRLIDGVRLLGQDESELSLAGPEEIGAIAAAIDEMSARYRAAQESAAEHARLQEEMQVAREIQASILPQEVPDIPGYEIARLYRPVQEVGGDYYDFLDVGEGLTGVVVADVAGKGVPASLVMSMVRTALRMETRSNANAGDVLARLHAFISADMRKGMFVTMLYAVLDSRNRIISYASAGHTPMLLYRARSDETFFLNPRGIPVGLAGPDAQTFERSLDVEKLRLHAGDLLLLYTDGITEARNAAGEQYGEERLAQALGRWGRESAAEFVRRLEEDLAEHTGAGPLQDDLTLVAIREKQGAPEVQGELRRKLADLIEKRGVPVLEACSQLHVSPSTYYRFKRDGSADELELQHLSVEKRAWLQRLVAAHPEMTPRELAETLRSPEWGGFDAAPTLVHAELRRMDLLDPGRRAAQCARRVPHATPENSGAPAAPSALVPLPGGAAGAPAPVLAAAESAPAASAEATDGGLFVQEGCLRGLLERSVEAATCAFLHLEGSLDSGSCSAFEELLQRASEIRTHLVVDLSHVAYVSSRGWGLLAAAAAELRPRGELALCGMRHETHDVYRMLGFEPVIRAFPDRDAARAGLGTRPAADRAAAAEPPATAAFDANGPAGAPALATASKEPLDAGREWESLRLRVGRAGPDDRVTVVELHGILDTVSAYRFERALGELVGAGARHVLVDLSCLEFVSSAGWGTLAVQLEGLRRAGGDLRVFGMRPEVERIYRLLHLQGVLPCHDLLAEALASFALDTPASAAAAVPPPTALAEPPPAPAVVSGAPEHASGKVHELDLGALRARLEPFGRSGGAQSLHLHGRWDATTAAALEPWLAERGGALLLIVDASGLEQVEAPAWAALRRHAERVREAGGSLRVVGVAPGFVPPRELGLPVHTTVAAALRAHQRRRVPALGCVRLPEAEFHRDHEIRREGWSAYLDLLREALKEESS